MKATFRYVHLDHSPSLEEHAEKKLESIEHLVAGYEGVRAEVEMERTTEHHKSGDVYKVRMRLFLPGHVLDADESGNDLYAVVDKVRDTLHGAVQRFKEHDVARRRS
jgi:ribosomal subunit interface protein